MSTNDIITYSVLGALLLGGLISMCSSRTSGGAKIGANAEITVPYEGTMDTRFGYEGFSWGMTADECINVEGYPFVYKKNYENGRYTYKGCYGYNSKSSDGNTYLRHYAHGNVGQTDFYFINGYLYGVVDILKIENPSLEYLHSRYGDFSEENKASNADNSSIKCSYTNKALTNAGRSSLLINIYKDGKTYVYVTDPLLATDNHDVSTYLSDYKTGLKPDTWYIMGYTNGRRKAYTYYILTRNENRDTFIFYYRKDPDNPVLSVMYAGIAPDTGSVDGRYEIKTKDGLLDKRYSTQDIYFTPADYRYHVTYDSNESPRNMLNMALENESITVRHNDYVFTLKTSGLEEALSDYGITLDELDYAIANEEF